MSGYWYWLVGYSNCRHYHGLDSPIPKWHQSTLKWIKIDCFIAPCSLICCINVCWGKICIVFAAVDQLCEHSTLRRRFVMMVVDKYAYARKSTYVLIMCGYIYIWNNFVRCIYARIDINGQKVFWNVHPHKFKSAVPQPTHTGSNKLLTRGIMLLTRKIQHFHTGTDKELHPHKMFGCN